MQQNQVAKISDVKHPGYSKTVGETFFFHLVALGFKT